MQRNSIKQAMKPRIHQSFQRTLIGSHYHMMTYERSYVQKKTQLKSYETSTSIKCYALFALNKVRIQQNHKRYRRLNAEEETNHAVHHKQAPYKQNGTQPFIMKRMMKRRRIKPLHSET
eukprot:567190_1